MGNIKLKIGKAKSNDIVINNPFISDHHLEIFVDENNSVFISDLKSENGTFVNGRRLVGFLEVKGRDEVFIGNGYFLDWKMIVQDFNSKKNTQNLNIKRNTSKEGDSSNSGIRANIDLVVIYGLILIFLIYFFLML